MACPMAVRLIVLLAGDSSRQYTWRLDKAGLSISISARLHVTIAGKNL